MDLKTNMADRPDDGTVVRRALHFAGSVQGVGFRWRAVHAANAVGATGWVRNDFDGGVSMEIQGTEAQIDQVLLAIERGTYIMIEAMTAASIPAVEGERQFTVREDD